MNARIVETQPADDGIEFVLTASERAFAAWAKDRIEANRRELNERDAERAQ